ncbi:PAS/PAC sensor protein [Thioalkalivibrio versutus]|uniref:PAS/PAC sensor protein n=1 Tax=Thioalkalivibrio versutus TaxID=106634 RepID=A0A0G3G575_9GAMM|nr:PAS domain S-box protein [Thioalkalivibrio versutus]AKJ94607.1 PAS/PAC sensor protein [Thioalkalivibrio versutus]
MDPAGHAGAGLFHRAAVGLVFLEASGRIHAANARLAEWLGCAADDLHGVRLADCVPQGQHKALMDALGRAGSAEVTLELSLRAPNVEDATAVACTLVLAPDPDGRLATIQRRAPGDSAAQVYEQTFTANTAPKLLIDPEDGAIVDANPAAEAFYGYSAEALKGMRIQDINTLSADEVHAEMERAAREERRFFRFRHRICGGEIRDVEVYSGPVVLDGNRYLYSIIHDVSETRRYEHELEFYGVAFGRLPVGVYRNTPGPEGRFVRLNPAMMELFEAANEIELRSTPVRELYRDPLERDVFSRDLEAYGRVVGREVDLRTLRGRPFRARITAYRTEDADGRFVFDGVIEDVTELRAAEAFQTRLLGSLAEGVFGLDRYGRYTFLNPAACRLLGFESEGDALGRDAHSTNHHTLVDGTPYPPEACPIYRVLETGKPLESWDDHFARADGTLFPVSVFSAPTFDVSGRVDGAVVSFQDQTARRKREARLLKATSHLPGAIYQYRLYPDGRHAFPFVSEGVQRVYGLSPDKVQEDADAAFARVNPEDLPRIQASIEESARTLGPWQVRYRVRHPIRGTLWVEGRATPEAPRRDGSIVWHGVMIDITEQVAMEEALRERGEELAAAQRIAHVGSWIWTIQEDRTRWSDEVYRIFGLRREDREANYAGFLQAVHPDDRDRVAATVESALETGDYDIHFRVLRPDGCERVVHTRGAVERDTGGKPRRLIGTVQDVTARRALEENLRRLVGILEHTPDVVGMHGPDGSMLFLNAGGRALFGLPPASGEPWDPETGWNTRGLPAEVGSLEGAIRRFHPPWAADEILQEAAPVAVREGIWQGETAVLDGEGRVVPVSQVIIVRRDDHGQVRQISTILRDISQRKAVEDALRESEARFRQLAGSVNEVFWLQDEHSILYVNPAYERVWGYSREHVYRDSAAMLEAVHPEDRARVDAVFLSGAFGDGTADETFRIRRPDGEQRWVRVCRYPIADTEGRVTRVAGTAVDITELKAAQQELERNQAELERQAFYDRLTGVANRRYFESLLDREVRRAERYGQGFALLMFDLDHFKKVNDTYGHATGDVVLQEVTRVAGERLRSVDVLGRWGGEEFMVLLPGAAAEEGARVAELVRARVAGHPFPRVGEVTVSLGVAAFHSGEPRGELLRRVDEALYRAKREGRNRVALAPPPAA